MTGRGAYEWMYVLSGRLRLRLGEHDFIMKAGEVAGPQGERIHVRARPRSRPASS